MSNESLWMLADWLHAFTDGLWVVYKALAIVAGVVIIALLIAEIANLYK